MLYVVQGLHKMGLVLVPSCGAKRGGSPDHLSVSPSKFRPKGRVHTAQAAATAAAAIADATALATRATKDIGVDAIDPVDEGADSVLAPVGEIVGAEEYTGV